MQPAWDDWEIPKLDDTSLWTRVLIGVCLGLVVPWLLQTWNTRRKQAPVKYTTSLPDRLRDGQGYEVDEDRRVADEVCT